MSRHFSQPIAVARFAERFDLRLLRELARNGQEERWLCSTDRAESSSEHSDALMHVIVREWPSSDPDLHVLLSFLEIYVDTLHEMQLEHSTYQGCLDDLIIEPGEGIAWSFPYRGEIPLDVITAQERLGAGHLVTAMIGVLAMCVRLIRIGVCPGVLDDPSRFLVSSDGSMTMLPMRSMHHLSHSLVNQVCFCDEPLSALRTFAASIAVPDALEIFNAVADAVAERTHNELFDAFCYELTSRVTARRLETPTDLSEVRSRDWLRRLRPQVDSSPESRSEPRLRHQQFDDRNSERGKPSNGQRFLHRVLSRRQRAS